MAKKSIGSLYGTIGGDASGWINELRKADDATRTRASSIGGQVSALGKRLSKDFSIVNLGRGVLGGFGIGSAAGVAMTAIDHFAGAWREAKEHSIKLDERAASIAKVMAEAAASWREMTLGAMPPERRLYALQGELARKMGEVEAQDQSRASALRGMALIGNRSSEFDPRFHTFEGKNLIGQDASNYARARGMSGKEFGDLLLSQMEDAQKRAAELRKEVTPLVKEIAGIVGELGRAGEEMKKNELEQTLRQAKETGPDMAALKEILPEDEARANAGLRRYREELRDQSTREAEQYLGRLEREAGKLRVDDMTRRGMGSGANFADWSKQTNTLLAEIRDLIRNLSTSGVGGLYASD